MKHLKPMERIRVFEAFAGYGSTAIALKNVQKAHPDKVGFDFVGISDIKEAALKAYKLLHGNVQNFGDISLIDWAQVPDFDLFTYSYPCTDLSIAGQQKGFERNSGTRSALLWECERAIQQKRPKYLLMENVEALIQKKFRPTFYEWQRLLEEMGYANFWQVLNAKHYGCPQNRPRVFMVSIWGGGILRISEGFSFGKTA